MLYIFVTYTNYSCKSIILPYNLVIKFECGGYSLLEAIRFILFSSLEAFAAFSLMLAIFRLKLFDFVWSPAFVFLIMSLVSYLLRAEMHLSYLVPALSVIVFLLILITIVKIPVIWSAIISAVGMGMYMTIQALVILMIFGSFTPDMQYSGTGTLIQLITSIIVLGIVFILQLFKFGFIADFEKLRFKFEHIIIIVFIFIALIGACYLMYFNNLYYIMLFFAILASVFIYYSFKKEQAAFD